MRDRARPGTWLEHSPLLTWFICALGVTYLVRYFMQAGEPLMSHLNTLNLAFLIAGFSAAPHAGAADAGGGGGGDARGVVKICCSFLFYAGIACVLVLDAPERSHRGGIRRSLHADDIPGRRRGVFRACWCRRVDRSG